MGTPEALFVLLFVGLPCAGAALVVARNRRHRNARHYVAALGRVAERRDDPDHDEFWGRR